MSFGQVQEQGGDGEGISLSSHNQTAVCRCLEMDQSVHRHWEPACVMLEAELLGEASYVEGTFFLF